MGDRGSIERCEQAMLCEVRATRTHGRALRFSMRPTCLVAFVACLVVGARSQSAGCGKESPQLPGTSASFWVEWDGAWYEHWLTIPLTYEVRARLEGPHRRGVSLRLVSSSGCSRHLHTQNKVPVPFMLYHHGWGGSR